MSTRRRRDEIAYELGYRGPRGGAAGAGDARIKAQKTDQFKRFQTEAMRETGASAAQLRRANSPFAQLYAKSYAQAFPKRKRGPFAKLLEFVGVRPADAPYRIGETPKGAT